MTWYAWAQDENDAVECFENLRDFATLEKAKEADPGLVNYKLYKIEVTECLDK